MKIHEYIDISKPIYFEENVYAHVVNNMELAKQLLIDNRVSADRLATKFKFVNQENPTIKELITFYSNWLMYMEGKDHKLLRNASLKYLANVAKKLDFNDFLERESTSYFIINQKLDVSFFIEDVVNSLMAKIVGLSKADYQHLIKKSKEIVSFLYNPSASETDTKKVMDSINWTKQYLQQIYNSAHFKEDSILHEMKKSNVFSIDVIVNIIVDGHDPLCSALHTAALNYFKEDSDYKEIITNSLKYSPPFTSIYRVAKERIKLVDNYVIEKGDLILCVLPQQMGCPYNNNQESIPFGYGPHTCLGKKISEECVKGLLDSFNKLSMRSLYKINNYEVNDTFGYFSYKDLTLDKIS